MNLNGTRKSKQHDTKAKATQTGVNGVSITCRMLDMFKCYAKEVSKTKKARNKNFIVNKQVRAK